MKSIVKSVITEVSFASNLPTLNTTCTVSGVMSKKKRNRTVGFRTTAGNSLDLSCTSGLLQAVLLRITFIVGSHLKS